MTFLSIIDMKNHALNPSVVTYEHDTRRLRHALLTPPLSQLWTPFIQFVEFVTYQQQPLFYHPILNARVYLLWTQRGLLLARSLFFSF